MLPKVYAIDLSEAFGPAKYFNSIASFITLLIPLIFAAASIVTLGMLILGSYIFLTAGGDPENLQKSKKIFKWAILGFVMVIISFILVRLIARILNINLFI